MLCFVWKSIQAENDAMEGNPSVREALTYHSHSSGCHRNLPGTNAGSHQFGLLETSAQMCWSTSRNSTCSAKWQDMGRAAQARDALVSARNGPKYQHAVQKKPFPSRPPEILEQAMDLCVLCSSCSTSHSTRAWVSSSHCTQLSPALLPASLLPGFPKTQKEIGTFPISHGLEINQRLSAVPGRALQSLHQTRECTLALTAAEKGQRLTAKVINPRDERWNEQSSTNRPWN